MSDCETHGSITYVKLGVAFSDCMQEYNKSLLVEINSHLVILLTSISLCALAYCLTRLIKLPVELRFKPKLVISPGLVFVIATYVCTHNVGWFITSLLTPRVVYQPYNTQDKNMPAGTVVYGFQPGARNTNVVGSSFMLPGAYAHSWCRTWVHYDKFTFRRCRIDGGKLSCTSNLRAPDNSSPPGAVQCEVGHLPKWCRKWWDGLSYRNRHWSAITTPKTGLYSELRKGEKVLQPAASCDQSMWAAILVGDLDAALDVVGLSFVQ